MSFRLRLLLSNLDEHWEDPDFRKTVSELLASTVERLEGIAGRFGVQEDAVLIKVSLDVNGLLRAIASRPARRGRAGRGAPAVSLALGDVPRIWADPSTSATRSSLIENAGGGRGARRERSSCGLRRRHGAPAARRRRDHRQRRRHDARVLRDRLFEPFATTKPQGVGLGLATAHQIVRFHRGSLRVLSQPGGGTLVRVSFPAIPEDPA